MQIGQSVARMKESATLAVSAKAAALKAAGKPVEFVTFKNEDHFLLRSAPRTQLLETLGAFLAKNLPVNP